MENPHFMSKLQGPAKQFAVIVGDDSGVIEAQLQKLSPKVDFKEPNIYIIDNQYYCSKYGLQKFSTLPELMEDFKKSRETPRPYFLVVYKGIAQLKEAERVAEIIKADTRIVIFDSVESCKDAELAEKVAAQLAFDWVYLNPNEDQKAEAEDNHEKTGMERVMETLEVCEWPFRVANLDKKTGMLDFSVNDPPEEVKVTGKDLMTHNSAEMLTHNYAMWMRVREAEQEEDGAAPSTIPSPMQAELVHLSSTSPTTTEGTVITEDNNITVDFDFVNQKQESKNETSTAQKKPKNH